MLQNILKLSHGLLGKVTKLAITVGRILISRGCRTTTSAVNYAEPMTQSEARLAFGQLSCGRHTDRLRHAKNAGFRMNLDTESFFGTLIRMTGNGRARLWFVIVFLRRLSGVRLSYPTIFTREPSRRCPLLWMHWKQRGSNLSRSRNYFAWQRRNPLTRRLQARASRQAPLRPLLPLNNLLRAARAV